MRVFRFFENLLDPTALPPTAPPPSGLGAFYWYHARQARLLVLALFVAGSMVALLDTTIPVFIGRVVTLVSSHAPGTLLRRKLAPAVRHGGGAAGRAAVGAAGAEADHQPGDRAGISQSRSLAEPLARGAAELDLFPERFCRPHRQPRHADRPGAARKRRLRHQRRLVHPRLRQRRDRSAGPQRHPAGNPDPAAGSPAMPVLLRYFVPRLRNRSRRSVGGALSADRPGRRQLHQHPDGQAFRAAARRGRICARGGRRSDRGVPTAAAADDAVGLDARDPQRRDGGRHECDRHLAVERRADLGRHRGDGDAADLADLEHRRLGGAERDDDLREYRRRAGRDALDRGAASDDRPGRCGCRCRSSAGSSALRMCALATGPRAASCTASI